MDSLSKRSLRLRYLLGRYGKVFVVSLVLMSTVAFASAALAYTAAPETRQVTEQTDIQSFETTVNTSATVTGNTSLYESGRTLSNMPVYLVGASPNVTVTAHTEVPGDRAVNVSQQITLELYATRNGEVFWSNTTTLAADAKQVTDGSLVTETTINVREVRSGRLSEVQSEAESVGAVQVKIHADTVYKSDTYEGNLAVTAPIEIADRSYAIDAPRSDERSHATPVTRTITGSGQDITAGTPVTSNATAQAGFLTGLGFATPPTESIIRGGLGVFALVAALIMRRVHDRLPDPGETKQTYDKVRHGDWISRGRIPESDAYERVVIKEFVDLIDIAIDSDKRVIHDRDRDLYAVIDGTVIYRHGGTQDQTYNERYPYLRPGWTNKKNHTSEPSSRGTQMTDGGVDPRADGSSGVGEED
jgi:biopolymer transport protein ExbD